MNLRGFACGLALATVLGPLAGFSALAGAGEDTFSEANTLLFLEDHLTQTDYAAEYVYLSQRSGAGDNDYSDRITMTALNAAGSDAKHVKFSAPDTDRGRQIQDIENARGNPLIMVFLQSDVLELADATGGHWRYFQKQMKLALENNAEVEPVTVAFQGKQVDGRRITVRPYASDQTRRNELGRFRDKTYEFILSDQIPGRIYELRSTVPAEADSNAPVVEKLTLQAVEKVDGKS